MLPHPIRPPLHAAPRLKAIQAQFADRTTPHVSAPGAHAQPAWPCGRPSRANRFDGHALDHQRVVQNPSAKPKIQRRAPLPPPRQKSGFVVQTNGATSFWGLHPVLLISARIPTRRVCRACVSWRTDDVHSGIDTVRHWRGNWLRCFVAHAGAGAAQGDYSFGGNK